MLPLIGMAAGLIPAVAGMIGGAKQKKMGKQAARQADALNAQTLDWANKGLGTAQGLQAQAQNNYQARMAGATQAEQNIARNQANTMARASRGATSSSDLLAMAGASQGQANDAFSNLATMEAQDKQNRLSNVQQMGMNVQQAQGNMQNYFGGQAQQAQQSANELFRAGAENQMNALNQVANVGMTAAMGGFGGLGGMLGKGAASKAMAGSPVQTMAAERPNTLSAGLQGGMINFTGRPNQFVTGQFPQQPMPVFNPGQFYPSQPQINFGLNLGGK